MRETEVNTCIQCV